MPRARPPLAPKPAATRSRVSNGSALLAGVDQRSALARRYRDICSSIATDQGGADRLSEARLQLIRRFAAASVLAEQMEAKLASGGEVDITVHAQLSSTLVRLAGRIGINRASKNVTPTVTEYIEQLNRETG